jgi:hypothetical protein
MEGIKNVFLMKRSVWIPLIIVIVLLSGCNPSSSKKPDKIYQYKEEEKVVLNDKLQERIGDWAEEGMVCYGLAVLRRQGVGYVDGAVIKARILRIKSDSVKMKSLETVNLAEVEGCTKMGISAGDVWWETEGDLFQTREAAQEYLSGILKKKKKSGKFRI